MAKQTFILTHTNNTEIIGGNVEEGKAISLRGAFLKANGVGFSGVGMIPVHFKHTDSNGAFNIVYANDNQSQVNPDGFNYPLISGKEVAVFAEGLQPEQTIYMEVEYELLTL